MATRLENQARQKYHPPLLAIGHQVEGGSGLSELDETSEKSAWNERSEWNEIESTTSIRYTRDKRSFFQFSVERRKQPPAHVHSPFSDHELPRVLTRMSRHVGWAGRQIHAPIQLQQQDQFETPCSGDQGPSNLNAQREMCNLSGDVANRPGHILPCQSVPCSLPTG